MSYIATGRYIDSTNRNGTFKVEVPSTDRRHIEKVVMSRYVAKKVIVNSVNPSPSMIHQQHVERTRMLDEERRQRASAFTAASNNHNVPRAHMHAPQAQTPKMGFLPFIGLTLAAVVFAGAGGESAKDIVPAAVSDAPQSSLSVPTRPSEYVAPNRMDVFYPTPAEQRQYLPEPIEVVSPVIGAEPFDIRDRPRRGR